MGILLGQTCIYLAKYREKERLIVNLLLSESTQGKSKIYYFNIRKKELLEYF